MNKTTSLCRRAAVIIFCLAAFAAGPAQAQEVPVQRGAKVINETHHDLSPPLSDLVEIYGQQPVQPAPQHVAPLGRSGNPYTVPPGERDPALQVTEETEGPLVSTTNLLNFDGLTASQSGGVAPPDTNGTVGTTQFVQTVNTAYEVFDKTTGASLLGPTQINVIFSGFGGACDTGPYFTDPIVLFDKMASRWVVSIAGSVDGFQTGLECVAVSTSADATGSYNRYSFSFGNNFGDYPKLGSWPDAYYLTVNEFGNTGVLEGAQACALDRTNMLAGNPATAQCFFPPTESVLYSFTGGADGAYPYAGVIRDVGGNLYGTTIEGGAYNAGTVFKLDTTGKETVLYSFTGGADGLNPFAGLVHDTAGNLYGTTVGGGALGWGTVFKIDTTRHETVLYSFTGGADGGNPYYGNLILDAAGNLYGTAAHGGDSGCNLGLGCGVVFELDTTGQQTVLYSFTGGADGGTPYTGLIQDSVGNLYGTATYGGNYITCPIGCGVVFNVSPSHTETVLYSFTAGVDGALPFGGLVRDASGSLYGTTVAGGSGGGCQTNGVNGCGTVFKVSPTSGETVLHSFTAGGDGAVPLAGLVRDAAGNLYGTTETGGGAGGNGTVFEVSTSGTETVLYSFTGRTDGAGPVAGLVRDAAGSLYGSTLGGGAGGYGTVFKVILSGTLMPADFDGTVAPPPGEPNFLLSMAANAPGKSLSLFRFHVDFTNPANSTLTGPTTLAVKSYNEACGGQGTCIAQSGTSQQLDSLGDRLMFRLAYRNFGDHESLVVNHSVNPGITGIAAAPRWYEIRNPNGAPTVYQQGTFSSKTNNYWMGSVAMDKNGDMALGFSASSSTAHPSIFYTGRVPTDPLGTMESAKPVITGSGSQNGGLSRWGDYSSMAIDPSDDCTFWYTNEYLKTSGSFNWNTRIVKFKFNSCQ